MFRLVVCRLSLVPQHSDALQGSRPRALSSLHLCCRRLALLYLKKIVLKRGHLQIWWLDFCYLQVTPKVYDICDLSFCWDENLSCLNCQLVCSGEAVGQWAEPARCPAYKLNSALFFSAWSGSHRNSQSWNEDTDACGFYFHTDEVYWEYYILWWFY